MKKKQLKDKPIIPLPEDTENDLDLQETQTMNQKKIALVQGGNGPVIIEMIKDILQKVPIVGKDQWETTKNAIIIDTSSTVLKDMVEYIEDIKRGSLIGKK